MKPASDATASASSLTSYTHTHTQKKKNEVISRNYKFCIVAKFRYKLYKFDTVF